MESYASEKEQIDAIKKWWKENASSTITGVLLGLSVLFGIKAWFSYEQRQAESASHLYVQFMNALGQGDRDAMTKAGDLLIADYSGSPYAAYAAMGLAKVQVEAGEHEAAAAQLQWALDHPGTGAISNAARLRLARLLITDGKQDEAQAQLDKVLEPGSYGPLFAELRGDLALARGNQDVAHLAYGEALAGTPAQSPRRQLLELKFSDTTAGEATP